VISGGGRGPGGGPGGTYLPGLEYEGREVEGEELDVSENRDCRRPLLQHLQHQAKNISSSKPPKLTPMMMPPACSRLIPVSVVVAAAAVALRATANPVVLSL
jgi:hypothetical protein